MQLPTIDSRIQAILHDAILHPTLLYCAHSLCPRYFKTPRTVLFLRIQQGMQPIVASLRPGLVPLQRPQSLPIDYAWTSKVSTIMAFGILMLAKGHDLRYLGGAGGAISLMQLQYQIPQECLQMILKRCRPLSCSRWVCFCFNSKAWHTILLPYYTIPYYTLTIQYHTPKGRPVLAS